MKRIASLILMLGVIIVAHSQVTGFKVKSSEVMSFKLRDWTPGFVGLGSIKGKAYFLFLPYQPIHGPTEFVISTQYCAIGILDENCNIIKKSELILKQGEKDLQAEGVLLIKDKILLFSSFKNTKDKKHYLFVQNINTQTLECMNDIKMIAELSYDGLSKFDNTVFNYEISPDSSKVLVFYTLRNKKNEAIRAGLSVFDDNMNKLWSKDNVSSQLSSGFFEYKQFKIDNNGDVYLLGLQYSDKSNYFDDARFRKGGIFSTDTYFTDKPNFTFELYKYSDNGQKTQKHSFSLADKFIRSLNFKPSENNIVNCYGMYSAKGQISTEGSFTFNLNVESNEVTNLNLKEFGQELISRELDENELKRFRKSIEDKQEWDPYDYILSDLKTRQNGEKYFIAEQYIRGLKKVSDGKTIYYLRINLHNDLYVVSLNTDNQIGRIDKITKRQYWLTSDEYNSYEVVEKNNKLYFIYNTFAEATKGLFKTIDIGDSYLTSLDENGQQKKSVIKKKDDDKLPFPIIKSAIKVSGNTLIYGMLSTNQRKYQFQYVTITE